MLIAIFTPQYFIYGLIVKKAGILIIVSAMKHKKAAMSALIRYPLRFREKDWLDVFWKLQRQGGGQWRRERQKEKKDLNMTAHDGGET
jgi:hypothetical protein